MAQQSTKIPKGGELINAQTLLEKIGIEEKMKIADLGCGRRGHFSLQAAKLIGNKGLVYAVDVVKDILKNVQGAAQLYGIENIKTIWADLEVLKSTKIDNASVDIAMLNNILFQTKKKKEIVNEAVRILKKGGKLLIIDWKKTKAPFGPPVDSRVKPDAVKEYVQKCGLTLTHELNAGPHHYALVFKKA